MLSLIQLSILTAVINLANAFINLIYPPACLLCYKPLLNASEIICPLCRNSLCFNTPPFCPTCSRQLRNAHKKKQCLECQKRRPDFDRAWSSMVYTKPMKELLHLFKYRKKTALKNLFAELIILFLERYHVPVHVFDYLIPMPIHPTKEREREFNQTLLIARKIQEHYSLNLSLNNLVRVKHSQTQAFLEEKERWTNIQDAFKIRQPLRLKNRSVLILDDLMTTGATACEAAKTCKNSGASYVGILTLAVGK